MTIRQVSAKGWIVVALVILTAVVAVYVYMFVQPWQHDYKGDGEFTDNGISASSYRYVLQLDKYRLIESAGKKHEYEVGRLPQTDMHLAFRFLLSEGEPRELLDGLRVRIAVSELGGQPYFRYDGPLYSQDASFISTSYRHSANEMVVVMYSREPFTQPVTIFGQQSGLYRIGKRRVEFELLDSIGRPLRHNWMELIIFGGGWK